MRDLRARLGRGRDNKGNPDLSPLAATFLRGLSLGVLVGAAIAGSAIWRRLRQGAEEHPKLDGRPSIEQGRPDDVA